jgi:hypothetical protein
MSDSAAKAQHYVHIWRFRSLVVSLVLQPGLKSRKSSKLLWRISKNSWVGAEIFGDIAPEIFACQYH